MLAESAIASTFHGLLFQDGKCTTVANERHARVAPVWRGPDLSAAPSPARRILVSAALSDKWPALTASNKAGGR